MSETITLPSVDHVWDVREQILICQQAIVAFFKAENWIMAFRGLGRLERLTRRLPALFDPATGREPRPAPPPPPGPSPRELYESFTNTLARLNEERRETNHPPISFEEMLTYYAEDFGDQAAAPIAAYYLRHKRE